MLEGFIVGLFSAWVLSLFGVDSMLLEVIQSFNKTITFTSSHYYILFGLIGLIGGAFTK